MTGYRSRFSVPSARFVFMFGSAFSIHGSGFGGPNPELAP